MSKCNIPGGYIRASPADKIIMTEFQGKAIEWFW